MKSISKPLLILFTIISVLVVSYYFLEKTGWLGIYYNKELKMDSAEFEQRVYLCDSLYRLEFSFIPRLTSRHYKVRISFPGEQDTRISNDEGEKLLNLVRGYELQIFDSEHNLLEDQSYEKNRFTYTIGYGEILGIGLVSGVRFKKNRKYYINYTMPATTLPKDEIPEIIFVLGISRPKFSI